MSVKRYLKVMWIKKILNKIDHIEKNYFVIIIILKLNINPLTI